MTPDRIVELKHALDVAETFLRQVRELHWATRLKELRALAEADPVAAVDGVLAAFDAEHGLDRLYLSGPRNGHNLSERQEIEANGKLHVIRSHLRGVAKDIGQPAAS